MKIEMGKSYKTRDGREARVLCTDREHPAFPVVALIGCSVYMYKPNGQFNSEGESHLDLIEVKPRIKREAWINVYPDGGCHSHRTKADAERLRAHGCLACVRVPIDCEVGEGL